MSGSKTLLTSSKGNSFKIQTSKILDYLNYNFTNILCSLPSKILDYLNCNFTNMLCSLLLHKFKTSI